MLRAVRISVTNGCAYSNVRLYTSEEVDMPQIFMGKRGTGSVNQIYFKCPDGRFLCDAEDITIIQLNNHTTIPRKVQGLRVTRLSLEGDVVYDNPYLITSSTADFDIPNIFGEGQIAFVADDGMYLTTDYKVILIQL